MHIVCILHTENSIYLTKITRIVNKLTIYICECIHKMPVMFIWDTIFY